MNSSMKERPTIKWGLVIWGMVFLGTSILTISMVLTGDSRFLDWLIGVDPGQLLIAVAVIVGGLALIFGMIGMLNQSTTSKNADRKNTEHKNAVQENV